MPDKKDSPAAKDKYIRSMIAFMASDKTRYYRRGDQLYVDTRCFRGAHLMALDGPDFRSFMLRLAKTSDNLLLRHADIELIVQHVQLHAKEAAKVLSSDIRAAYVGEDLYFNTGWENGKVIKIDQKGVWEESKPSDRIFEPLPRKMSMAVPEMREPTLFPALVKQGIGDFGDMHCLLCVTCATMMLPSTFVHPFLVFTGDQARGKSTTMKLLIQLIDPYESSELMTVGEDIRDIIALVRGRHSIALDNVSKLPFDEDLLSKMYSGGVFSARKMTTNSELSEVELPRLRVMMNGIGTAFTRSDLMSRCIFIDHPAMTKNGADGREKFKSLELVEQRWLDMRPQLLGSLLRAIGAGLKTFRENGGYADKESESRFVEYAVIGECISQAMGFEKDLFTKQVHKAGEEMRSGAIEADDCAQLVLSWLGGESGETQIAGWEEETMMSAPKVVYGKDSRTVSPTDLFSEIKALANKRGFAVYSMKWLMSSKALSSALMRSKKNIENGGWTIRRITGGEHNRKFEFTRIKKAAWVKPDAA